MYSANAREKYLFFNNLVCLVDGLCGKYTTVDLRNESFVTGKIDQVDGFMNIVMKDTVFTDGRGQEHPFEMFFIQARNIRYVHIPDDIICGDLQRISQPSVGRIITEISEYLARHLGRYVKFPSAQEAITHNKRAFYEIAGFPDVMECIDYTHIPIRVQEVPLLKFIGIGKVGCP